MTLLPLHLLSSTFYLSSFVHISSRQGQFLKCFLNSFILMALFSLTLTRTKAKKSHPIKCLTLKTLFWVSIQMLNIEVWHNDIYAPAICQATYLRNLTFTKTPFKILIIFQVIGRICLDHVIVAEEIYIPLQMTGVIISECVCVMCHNGGGGRQLLLLHSACQWVIGCLMPLSPGLPFAAENL